MSDFNKTWTPVDVSYKHSGGSFAVSGQNGQFDKLVEMATNRPELLDTYDDMDTMIDIGRALDIIAEDVSSDDVADSQTFMLDFPDEVTPKASTLEGLEVSLRRFSEMTEFDHRFFDYAREALKYGMVMFRKIRAKKGAGKEFRWVKVAARNILGYKMVDENLGAAEHAISHYLLDTGKTTYAGTMDAEEVKIEDLFILKNGHGPWGQSILDKVYRVWKQTKLLEDAIIIYRIVRAPERRLFSIDIGDQPTRKAEAYLQRVKVQLKQKQIAKSGSIDSIYNPANMQEDYFVTTNSEGRGTKIETLPGGENVGKIEDLEFFNKKLALALRIPPSYLDSFNDGRDGSTFNDGRVGTAYVAEMRYVGYICRIQKGMARSLFAEFKMFLTATGVELPEELIFKIAPPQSFAIYKENELQLAQLNTFSQSDGIAAISTRLKLQKYLGLTPTEMQDNEDKVLEEMGIAPKEVTDIQRINLVYGDKSLLTEVRPAAVPPEEPEY
jgi:hypothetical protein